MRVSLKANEGEVFDTHVGHRPWSPGPCGQTGSCARGGAAGASVPLCEPYGHMVRTCVHAVFAHMFDTYVLETYVRTYVHDMDIRTDICPCVCPRCVQDVDVRTNIRSYFVHRGRAYEHMEHAHHCTDTLIMVLTIIMRIPLYGHAHRRGGCVHAVMSIYSSTSWTHA